MDYTVTPRWHHVTYLLSLHQHCDSQEQVQLIQDDGGGGDVMIDLHSCCNCIYLIQQSSPDQHNHLHLCLPLSELQFRV